MFKALEKYFGKNFLQCNTFLDFMKDGFKLFIFIFSPWVLLGTVLMIETLLKIIFK